MQRSKIKDHFQAFQTYREEHKDALYSIAWSQDVYEVAAAPTTRPQPSSSSSAPSQRYRILASCAGRHVSVHEIAVGSGPEGSNRSKCFRLIQRYIDPDVKEHFFACAFAGRAIDNDNNSTNHSKASWHRNTTATNPTSPPPLKLQRLMPSEDTDEQQRDSRVWPLSGETGTGPQLLCVAGQQGRIQLIDTSRQRLVGSLVGHGYDIYDLQPSPTDEYLLLSASKDNTVRLWNLKTGALVAVFAGDEGHQDDVVSLSWHCSGNRFVSGSTDNTAKIWDCAEGTNVRRAIDHSHVAAERLFRDREQIIDRPVEQNIPSFTAKDLHFTCVDCVQFLGDLIMSRGLEDKIYLWEPILPAGYSWGTPAVEIPYPVPSKILHLRTYPQVDSQYWWLRFGVDANYEMMVAGNIAGELYAWPITDKMGRSEKLNARTGGNAVRAVAFSPDNDILVVCTDAGSLIKWDFKQVHNVD